MGDTRWRSNRNRLVAWVWLKGGFCPRCYSSPPRPTCPVCRGTHHYGSCATPERRAEWRTRFALWRAGIRIEEEPRG